MSEPKTVWTFNTTATFTQLVSDEYNERFDGKYQYTKDLVLGATTAAQSYVDLGAFEVGPLTLRIEFTTSALRNTFQGMIGTTATLSNTNGRSYTAMLTEVRRIENGGMYLADATWEQR
jgi:hypothetical protein